MIKNFYNWKVTSDHFEFNILSDGNEVLIRKSNYDKDELFSGNISNDKVVVYSVIGYLVNVEIDYPNRTINLLKVESDE